MCLSIPLTPPPLTHADAFDPHIPLTHVDLSTFTHPPTHTRRPAPPPPPPPPPALPPLARWGSRLQHHRPSLIAYEPFRPWFDIVAECDRCCNQHTITSLIEGASLIAKHDAKWNWQLLYSYYTVTIQLLYSYYTVTIQLLYSCYTVTIQLLYSYYTVGRCSYYTVNIQLLYSSLIQIDYAVAIQLL